jgi:hypothetical protein
VPPTPGRAPVPGRQQPPLLIVQAIRSGSIERTWRGFETSGQEVRYATCIIFNFEETDRIVSEEAYYDILSVAGQLGYAASASEGIARTGSPGYRRQITPCARRRISTGLSFEAIRTAVMRSPSCWPDPHEVPWNISGRAPAGLDHGFGLSRYDPVRHFPIGQ